ALEAHRSIGPEKAVAVRHRPAEPLAIEARQGRYDVLRGMRNERGEMIAADGAVVEQEVQQMRHLLEVRRYVGVVASQMNVVELEINDPLDLVAGRLKVAGRLHRRRGFCVIRYDRDSGGPKQELRQQPARQP